MGARKAIVILVPRVVARSPDRCLRITAQSTLE
jgi:hypothetical protein